MALIRRVKAVCRRGVGLSSIMVGMFILRSYDAVPFRS